MFFSVLFFRFRELSLAYLAATLHECAHLTACVLLKVRPRGIKLGIAGAELKTDFIESTTKKIIISAAGPAMSFATFIYMYAFGLLFGITNYIFRFFALANLGIGIINLLPVPPLDGGAIVKSSFVKYMGIITGNRVYMVFSSFFFGIFAICNLWLCFTGVFNPWLFLILAFAFGGAHKEKLLAIKEKKRVLSGDVGSSQRLKLMACDCESELLCLASRIGFDYTLLVATFCSERFFGEINQFEITEGIKKYGALCTAREYIEKRKLCN